MAHHAAFNEWPLPAVKSCSATEQECRCHANCNPTPDSGEKPTAICPSYFFIVSTYSYSYSLSYPYSYFSSLFVPSLHPPLLSRPPILSNDLPWRGANTARGDVICSVESSSRVFAYTSATPTYFCSDFLLTPISRGCSPGWQWAGRWVEGWRSER